MDTGVCITGGTVGPPHYGATAHHSPRRCTHLGHIAPVKSEKPPTTKCPKWWGIGPVTALGLNYRRDPIQRGPIPRYGVSSAIRRGTLPSTAHRKHPSIVTRMVLQHLCHRCAKGALSIMFPVKDTGTNQSIVHADLIKEDAAQCPWGCSDLPNCKGKVWYCW